MKYFLSIFILFSFTYASSINNSMLQIHATLVPKIVLMDFQLKDKIKNNTVSLAIAYNQSEKNSALKLKNMIYAKYQDQIKQFKLDVKIYSYQNISMSKANIYYLFPTNPKNIQKTIKVAAKNKALTFSYEKQNLKLGTMLSLNVGSKVKPILNLKAVKHQDITLRPVLLKISDIYTDEGLI